MTATATAPDETPSIRSFTHAEWPAVASTWSELVDAAPGCSFFLRREWVESWIAVFGEVLRPEVLIFDAGGRARAACLLVRRTIWRGPIPIRRVHLNTAGEDDSESVCVEFNDLLCLAGWAPAVVRSLRDHLRTLRWDELVLDGFSEGPTLDALRSTFSECVVNDSSQVSHLVDLARLRADGTDYAQTLTSSRRYRLRKGLKRLEEHGPVALTVAPDLAQAEAMLRALVELHQKAWTERGQPGSFGAPRFLAFHRELLRRAVPVGLVELLQVTAGQRVVGLHYNFVLGGRVFYYQSGYDYELRHLGPGFVCQALVVRHSLERGLDEYHLMAGAQPYKAELAPSCVKLHWVVLQRSSIRLRLVDILRRARERLRSELARRRKQGAEPAADAGASPEQLEPPESRE